MTDRDPLDEPKRRSLGVLYDPRVELWGLRVCRACMGTLEGTECPVCGGPVEDLTVAEVAPPAKRRALLAALLADPEVVDRERLAEVAGTAVHGYACGCDRPWPTNVNYEEMADATVAAVLDALGADR